MSHIGSNIRKIRGVKNLNQSAFAELFELKRASVGAYEEGRAEPKINTIIDIAKHFGISIDDLLTKELSVNDLYKFDIFREDIVNSTKHNLTPSSPFLELNEIPFISKTQNAEFLLNYNDETFLKSLPICKLPLIDKDNFMAFELFDNSMLNRDSGFSEGDFIIGHQPKQLNINKLELNKYYLFQTTKEFLFRKLTNKTSTHYTLSAENSNLYQIEIAIKSIVQVWQVKMVVTNNFSNTTNLDDRLTALENQISNLSSK